MTGGEDLGATRMRRLTLHHIVRAALVAACAVGACACGDDDSSTPPARVVVLSAFPAEMAPLLAQTTVDDTKMIGDHVFRIGVLGGVPVVLGLTGIGLANAAMTTHAVLEQFTVVGIVFSGVANSTHPIGDVVVPTAWEFRDGTTFTANQQWLDLANAIAASGTVTLERCTQVQIDTAPQQVCMPQPPAVVVGGLGRSTDPFSNRPFPCQPGAGDLYGCDVEPAGMASAFAGAQRGLRVAAPADIAPSELDMETAAVVREATMRGVPFIGFRGVSDGAGDPLGLPGSLAQFSAYYRFAARNAAAATVAFLHRLAHR
jgi:nucleoside phosphorylase